MKKLSSELHPRDHVTILCWCGHVCFSLKMLKRSLSSTGDSRRQCFHLCHLGFVFASRCSCVIFLWLMWGFGGKNKTKQILDLPSPGAVEGTVPSYFSINLSNAVPALRACKIPSLPWQVRALAQVFLFGIWRGSCFQCCSQHQI